MKIQQIFNNKKPVISFEIFPPKKDAELNNIDATLEKLSELHPDFISVTFGAGGTCTNNKTTEIANKIQSEYKITPLVHLSCLNYSKAEINQVLDELKEYNIENILALRGDKNPDVMPTEEFYYATDLVKFIKENADFGISGACYPEKHLEAATLDEDIQHLKEKVDAGTTHLISQLFFDNQLFYSFLDKTKTAGINVPIEAGIMPVTNKAQIDRMISLCGASIPSKLSNILETYGDDKEKLFEAGIQYAIEQIIDLIENGVDGIHIYTMNSPKVAKKICEGISHLI